MRSMLADVVTGVLAFSLAAMTAMLVTVTAPSSSLLDPAVPVAEVAEVEVEPVAPPRAVAAKPMPEPLVMRTAHRVAFAVPTRVDAGGGFCAEHHCEVP